MAEKKRARNKKLEKYIRRFRKNLKKRIRQEVLRARFGSYRNNDAFNSYLTSPEGVAAFNEALSSNEDYRLLNNHKYFEIPAFVKGYNQYLKELEKKKTDRDEETARKNRIREQRELLKRTMIETIPDDYTMLYPVTRMYGRHFVLHIGPTNSGKTHHAIEALMKAEKGIYLAPLRLLAYEQFENMNVKGCLTSLVTGEESIEVPFSTHQSSTIEMLNTDEVYDMAVIDEAQMIADPGRGDAWTTAILGLIANEIHVCAAPEAEDILKTLILSCGDTYEVEYHDRNTPLLMEKEEFLFPDSVRKGDALIVFSRRDVHACAAELNKHGHRCSIIYGALPYNVRHREAKRFSDGETDVVVATDAIGMGLNMPIHRIVFLETSKFDGIDMRDVTPSEIKQIAGRAGRFGIFNEGYVNSLGDQEFVGEALESGFLPIKEAVIGFPRMLLNLDARLSSILTQWNSIEEQPGFRRSDLSVEIKLCQELEEIRNDKELIYRFITIPFDEENPKLKGAWLDFFRAEAEGREIDLINYIPNSSGRNNMNILEENFRLCDLIYYYMDRFGHDTYKDLVFQVKMDISERIMKLLSEQKLAQKKCRICGRPLPWNSRYSICNKCYERRRWVYPL